MYVREALLRLGAELVFDEALIEGTPHSKIGIRFTTGDACGPSWAFNKRNLQDLDFGISAWDYEDIESMQTQAIRTEMAAFCAMPSLTPTNWWPWWTYDTRAFSPSPVHSNWDTEPNAWLALQDHGQQGFAAHIINVATCFKAEFDLTVLHRKS